MENTDMTVPGNIYDFVNSSAIRDYWDEIGYIPAPIESAWLIWQSERQNLNEKHSAWEQIIRSTEDTEPLDISARYEKSYTLHTLLKEHIARENNLLDLFYDKSGDACYKVEIAEQGCCLRAFPNRDTVFTSLSRAMKEASDVAGYCTTGNADKIRITKYLLGKAQESIATSVSADFDKNMQVTSVKCSSGMFPYNMDCIFADMWSNFPVPFSCGDIVCRRGWDGESGFCRGPVALTNTTYDFCRDNLNYKGVDSSDMNVYGYFISEDGNLYQEVSGNLMDYEFYPAEKLEGNSRQLIAMSSFLKGEIDEDLLVRACCRIRAEEYMNSITFLDYTGEGLKCAGILSRVP